MDIAMNMDIRSGTRYWHGHGHKKWFVLRLVGIFVERLDDHTSPLLQHIKSSEGHHNRFATITKIYFSSQKMTVFAIIVFFAKNDFCFRVFSVPNHPLSTLAGTELSSHLGRNWSISWICVKAEHIDIFAWLGRLNFSLVRVKLNCYLMRKLNCSPTELNNNCVSYKPQRWADRYFVPLVRWSAAQRTTEMLADQRSGKNSGPAPADYQNWASASPLLNYLREVI